jgi:hypothetical protein
MSNLNPHKAGLALGGLIGLFHLAWSILVAAGMAQPLINWAFQLHMIVPPFTVASFSMMNAVVLVVITSIIGYVMGWVFASLWNRVNK